MLLYFSSDKNISIFDEETKKLGIDVKIETERCLTDYIRTNMNKLNHIEYLAIDLEYIIDEDIEILNTLSAFKICNSSITIVIVSFERGKGDMLLAKLFAEGIYNFVTSKNEIDMAREIKICLDHTQNNNYANAIGFKVDSLEETKGKRKGFWSNVLGNFKNKKEEKEFKVKETKLKKEKRPKKSKENVKNDIPFKEETYEDNWYDEDFSEEANKVNSKSSIAEKAKSSKEAIKSKENIDDKINSLFEKDDKSDRFISEKRRKKLEIEKLKDDVFLFYYYQKPVGIISKNVCIADKIYEKDDIIKFFQNQNIELKFEDNILQEIKEIKSYVERGDVYDCD